MTLIKTSFWIGISVFIKAIVAIAISKIVAIYTGPIGLTLIEQFQNFAQIIRTFSGSFFNQGIVKYVAEYHDNEANKTRVISSAVLYCIGASIFLGVILCIFSSPISRLILQSIEYQNVIIAFSASIILFSLNSLFLSILNGEREIKIIMACNIANTLLSLLLTLYFVIYHGLYGGFIALVCNQSIVLIITLFLFIRCNRFKLSQFTQGLDLISLNKLAQFAMIAIVFELAVPLSQVFVRIFVAHTLSWEEAGYWQGIMKLSNNYYILIDATMGIYFLPKIASLSTMSEIKKELSQSYKFILPLVMLASTFVFILKKPIIIILYSKKFLPMMALFKYQLIGDIARIGAWLLSYLLLAKGKMKSLFLAETSFMVIYPLITMLFVHYFGLIGTSMGFAVSNIIYWLIMLYLTYRYFKSQKILGASA
jgi:PST family polysaccharide transporter